MNIKQQMSDLRLHGMSSSWQALQESRRHYELTLTGFTALKPFAV